MSLADTPCPRTVEELEMELLQLQESTKVVVESSWAEVSRMHKENSDKDARIRELEKQLEIQKLRNVIDHGVPNSDKSHRGAFQRGRAHSVRNLGKSEHCIRIPDKFEEQVETSTRVTPWEETSFGVSVVSSNNSKIFEWEAKEPPKKTKEKKSNLLEDFSKHGRLSTHGRILDSLSTGRGSNLTTTSEIDKGGLITKQRSDLVDLVSTSSSHLRSLCRMETFCRNNKKQILSALEENLMTQLSVIQKMHTKEQVEAKLKLRQREESIKTLERALLVQADCVHRLRDENENLLKHPSISEISLEETEISHSSTTNVDGKPPRRKSLIEYWPSSVHEDSAL